MKKLTGIMLASAAALLLLGPVPSHAKPAKKKPAPSKTASVSAPQQAATAWLALVDVGKYAESWDAASPSFQAQVTKEQWVSAVTSARDPLGSLKSRTLKSGQHTDTLPDAPPGHYSVLVYDSNFEKTGASVETVALTQDKDGKWRVLGYFVKPA